MGEGGPGLIRAGGCWLSVHWSLIMFLFFYSFPEGTGHNCNRISQ